MNNNYNDRSREFNNAGVACLEAGHLHEALDLFRGALEAKLAYERSQQEQLQQQEQRDDSTDEEQQQHPLPCVTTTADTAALQAAEHHLANLQAYLAHPQSVLDENESRSSSLSASSNHHCILPLTIPVASRGYQPFLYSQPFALAASDNSHSSNNPHAASFAAQRKSAIIVFNLGLVHQRLNRSICPKAAAFYEIAAALLAAATDALDWNLTTANEDSDEEDHKTWLLLRVAIMNNFGVWCWENASGPGAADNGESLRTCMEHLDHLLEQHSSSCHGNNQSTCGPQQEQEECCLPGELLQGVQNNVRWFLTPPNGGSPAA